MPLSKKNTAACVIRWLSRSVQVEGIDSALADTDLVELISTADTVGIDVPFGWPTDFVDAVACHHRFLPWPANAVRKLRYRETDLFVAEKTGHWPLSVSTDRIGVATMRAAGLFAKLGESVDRSGNGKLVEVYPAAALRQWGFDPLSYKGKNGREKRKVLVEAFLRRTRAWLRLGNTHLKACQDDDNMFDALISALVARARAVDLTEPVPSAIGDRFHTEGWIALPLSNSLEKLAAFGLV